MHAIPNETRIGFQEQSIAEGLREDFDKMALAASKWRWVEKTPSHIKCLDRLFRLVPGARVILLIRDGRDVACSLRDRHGSLIQGIERWITDNRAGEPFWGHSDVCVVRYEDIVDDFDKAIGGVLEFLGEEFEPGMREFNKQPIHFYSNTIAKPPSAQGKFHNQYRNWQINQPLFDGRGRWRQLTDHDKDLIKKAAGQMLIDYDYADDSTW